MGRAAADPHPRRHAATRRLPAHRAATVVGRQRRELAQRAQAPPTECHGQDRSNRSRRSGRSNRSNRSSRSDGGDGGRRSVSGSGARTSASVPGAMTVIPARWWTSSRAAVRVPAMATRTRRPRSAAVARIDAAISRPLPNSRATPFRSSASSRLPEDLDPRRKLPRHGVEHCGITTLRCVNRAKHFQTPHVHSSRTPATETRRHGVKIIQKPPCLRVPWPTRN